jgi:AcrR family transcriptional regulator
MEATTAEKPRPKRLTQPERSAATRQALLDSTIECLVELGYQRATTAEISERAGLSRGAHQHHFQTRSILFAAAAGAVAERARRDIERLVVELPPGSGREQAALDACWELFSGPLFRAVLELAVQARADPELRDALEPAERMFGRGAIPLLRPAFRRAPDDERLDEVIGTALATIRGLALLRVLEPENDPGVSWPQVRPRLLSLLDGAQP